MAITLGNRPWRGVANIGRQEEMASFMVYRQEDDGVAELAISGT